MTIFKYRAVKLDVLSKNSLSIFQRLKRFIYIIFGKKLPAPPASSWVVKTRESVREGYIKAESMEYAIFKLLNDERLYPIDVRSLTPREAAAASRLLQLQEIQEKLEK